MSAAPNEVVPLRDGREVDRAFDALLHEIVTGHLSPGIKLNEPELSRRLGIKRGPLREAIRRLQGRNLVLCTPNAGARIVMHSPKDILDIYEMREGLESTAAKLCAERMTDAEIETLQHAARTQPPFYDGVHNADPNGRLSFHLQIIIGSRNNQIARILDESFFQLLKFWRTRYPWLRHSDELSRQDHQRIAEAISFRDGELAALLMRTHIRRSKNVIQAQRLRAEEEDIAS